MAAIRRRTKIERHRRWFEKLQGTALAFFIIITPMFFLYLVYSTFPSTDENLRRSRKICCKLLVM